MPTDPRLTPMPDRRLAEFEQDTGQLFGREQIRELTAEIRRLRAREAWLTDTVVMAAALWFGEITSRSEADYASETLHTTATDLVADNPRLKGAYKGGA